MARRVAVRCFFAWLYFLAWEINPLRKRHYPGDDASPIPVTKVPSTNTDAESTTSRVDAVTEAVLQAASGARRAAAENVADDTAMDARWMASESRLQSEAEKAAAAHDQAFAAQGIKRAADGEVKPAAASSAASTMPVIANWVTQQQGKVAPEQVKRMIVEMASVNRQKWSHEPIRAAVGGPKGSVHHGMASLSRAAHCPPRRRTSFAKSISKTTRSSLIGKILRRKGFCRRCERRSQGFTQRALRGRFGRR